MSELDRCLTDHGYGTQVSANRPDALDVKAVEIIRKFAARGPSGRRPHVLDIGCGVGSHSVQMAAAGADVFALDCEDYAHPICNAALLAGLDDRNVKFVQADARDLSRLSALQALKFELVFCQRMLHYIRYHEAVSLLTQVFRQMSLGGALCLGISGMNSELGIAYEHLDQPIADRFSELEFGVRHKHRIFKEVCLYRSEEAISMVQSIGFEVCKAWYSEFGNVKLIAEKSR